MTATAKEVVERLYAALTTGDRPALEALLAPDFVGTFAAGMPFGLGGTYQGTEAIDRGWWAIGRGFSARVEPSEWIDCVDGQLLVVGTYRGRARSTGKQFTAAYAHLFAVADGRLERMIQITDTARWQSALEE
jgi:2-(1,2-epoxy-1,2-dihydrophenyl)acetyl-CoA isomerase